MVAKGIVVDFTNVKDAGEFNPKHIAEGDYVAKVTKWEQKESKSGNQQIVFTIEVEGVRGSYPYYCGLVENQLWKLRNLLNAAGIAVPKKRLRVDPDKLVNKAIGVEMVDDEYEGRFKSVIDRIFPADEVVDTDLPHDTDEDDEPEVKPKRKAKPAPVEDDDEDDEEEEEEPTPAPRRKKKAAPEPEPEDDEEEDEEEEPAPKPKRKKKAAPVVEDDDELDLDEI